jgi:two-component system cell cycle sensor histidine kinase/response regulator CckA
MADDCCSTNSRTMADAGRGRAEMPTSNRTRSRSEPGIGTEGDRAWRPKVLVVDDDERLWVGLRRRLKRESFDLDVVHCGRDVLDYLTGTPVDLLVLNECLPDIDGHRIMAFFVESRLDTTVIVMTEGPGSEAAKEPLCKGACDFLRKPFEFEELRWRLQNALEHKRIKREKESVENELRILKGQYRFLVGGKGFFGVAPDAGSRLHLDGTLRLESERLAAILDGNPIPVFVIDKNHRIMVWNKACEVLTGIPKNRVIGQAVDSRLFGRGEKHPVLAELVLEMDEAAMAALYGGKGLRQSVYISEAFEVQDRMVIGESTRDVYIHAARIREHSGQVVGAIETIQDISERENLQRQLQHVHKMEAVGTLAGGMAHEFNNILASIQGYIQLMRMSVDEDDPLSSHLRESEASCRRAANLTHKMLTFARLDGTTKVPVKLNQIVESTHRLLQQTLPPSIEFAMDLQGGLPFVLAEPTQLEQVLLNLGLNARDAMPKGGVIRFCTALEEIDDKFCRRHPWAKPGRYIVLVVEDTGCGMPAKDLERIFEPFFSTKEPGKGTGLGLSIAYSIVKNHGGYILADSVEEQGSRFTIYFPIAEEDLMIDEGPAADNTAAVPLGRGERVLVVEDEAQLREITRDYLECHGYTPVLAANGQEAVQVYCELLENKTPVQLVIVDLAMPVMDGEACMQALLEVDPHVNLLVATGYDIERPGLHAFSNVAGVICKPFDFHDLLRKVRDILDR